MGDRPGESARTGDGHGRLDWSKLADGRPHRLKRGKHFRGDPKTVQREAREAAGAMGKHATTTRDEQADYDYLWVQFLEGVVSEGDPCPVCGGTELHRFHKHFVRCPTCGGRHELTPLQRPVPEPEPEPPALEAPSSDLAEILETRLLSPGGEEIESASTREEVIVETRIRLLRPVRRVIPRLTFLVGGRKVFRTVSPEPVEVTEPDTLTFSVRVPGAFLSFTEYSVHVSVHVQVDDTPESVALVRREALVFGALKTPREELSKRARAGRAAFEWALASERDSSVVRRGRLLGGRSA